MKMRLDSIILSFSRFVGLTTSVLYHMTMDKIDEALELNMKRDFLKVGLPLNGSIDPLDAFLFTFLLFLLVSRSVGKWLLYPRTETNN